MNNPLKYTDPLGMRAHTEHETTVAMHMYSLYSGALDSGDNQSTETYRTAYNTYNSTIRDIPEERFPFPI